MESYIVRIYRRNTDDPQEIIGLVEIVGTGIRKSFNTFDELRTIINKEAITEGTGSFAKRKKHGG